MDRCGACELHITRSPGLKSAILEPDSKDSSLPLHGSQSRERLELDLPEPTMPTSVWQKGRAGHFDEKAIGRGEQGGCGERGWILYGL